MAELQRPNSISLGQVGNLVSIAPRTPARTGLEKDAGDLQGVRASIQADTLAASTGREAASFGSNLASYGQQMLDPVLKLAQAREVLESQTAAIDAATEMRSQIQALKSSGADHLTWRAEGEKLMDKVEAEAVKKASLLSPAAADYVTRELQQERMRLTGDIQTSAFKAETDRQQANLVKLDNYARQTFFQLGTTEERAALSARLVAGYRTAAQTRLMKAEEAEKHIRDYQTHIEKNAATYLADERGLVAAMQYIEQSSIFTPEEKRQAESNVISYLQNRQSLLDSAEKAREKSLKLEQGFRAQQTLAEIMKPTTSIERLHQIVSELTTLSSPQHRAIDPEVARSLTKTIYDQIETRTKPVEHKDNQDRVNAWHALLIADGHNMDLNETLLKISQDTQVMKAAPGLMDLLKTTHDKNHFRNNEVFKGFVREIKGAAGGTNPFHFSLENEAGVKSDAEAAVRQLDQVLSQAAGPNGILSEDKLRQLGQPLVEQAVAQLRSKKTPNLGLSFDALATMGK